MKAPPPGAAKGATTAISLPADLLELLRIVAVKRARSGGRPSVSAVLVELVEKSRDELEAEAAGAEPPKSDGNAVSARLPAR